MTAIALPVKLVAEACFEESNATPMPDSWRAWGGARSRLLGRMNWRFLDPSAARPAEWQRALSQVGSWGIRF